MVVAAEVVTVMGKLGVKGVSRVRCRVVDGPEKGKIITRNVIGPIRLGDVVVLKDTSMDSEGKFQK